MLAHSAKPEQAVPTQSYADHVTQVTSLAIKNAREAERFSSAHQLLETIVQQAATYHDLGKLDQANQAVLRGEIKAKKLPVQHAEAGTVLLRESNPYAAILVRSHHIGLPELTSTESNRGSEYLRDRDHQTRDHVDQTLDQLVGQHHELLPNQPKKLAPISESIGGDPCVFLRLALSCLVDADHSDTAQHYGEDPLSGHQPLSLRPQERLQRLDEYVDGLSGSSESADLESTDSISHRNELRSQLYCQCRDADTNAQIVSCDSPVGSGKTTALMAHLLKQAVKRGLRRIIVVLPYTNIIKQSVDVYRKALVLPGESPDEVVAELHHQADFESLATRHLTALWRAPIVVTTAVNFFETLASQSTSKLRKLHQLPGSAIFVDESHAAVPAKFLPLVWRWKEVLADQWKCYWLLASGSQVEYWKLDAFSQGANRDVPNLVAPATRQDLAVLEDNRIKHHFCRQEMDVLELTNFIRELDGPVLCIVNTVQSAAVIAQSLAHSIGQVNVEHLSTALTPFDREAVLARVKKRLQDPNDSEWVLVATSCVEAGVDLSFKSGVRELASLNSLLQASGRVNRSAEEHDAPMWTVKLKREGLLKYHPMLEDSAWVLEQLFQNPKQISSENCTRALDLEIKRAGQLSHHATELCTAEAALNFETVDKGFKLIDSDTRLVVIDKELVLRLEQWEKVSWREIQSCSVQLWAYRIQDLALAPIRGHDGLFQWGDNQYDAFLGCMAGILKNEQFKTAGGAII